MTRFPVFFVLLQLAIGATAALNAGTFVAAESNGVVGEYLVVLVDSPNLVPTKAMEILANNYGGVVKRVWSSATPGGSMQINESGAMLMANDAVVALVQQNALLSLTPPLGCAPQQNIGSLAGSPQTIDCAELDPRRIDYSCNGNWGLDRIDQRSLPRDLDYRYDNTGAGVTVFTIDTGIRANASEFGLTGIHRAPDANVTIVGTGDPVLAGNTDDCTTHSHGTHVAGIIGSDSFGVAKSARLFPVKFADYCCDIAPQDPQNECNNANPPFRGQTIDDVDAALQYIATQASLPANQPAVVNLSGANVPAWDLTLQMRVQELIDLGVVFVQSAGNWDDGTGHDACLDTVGDEVPLAIIVGGFDINWVDGERIDGRWRREGMSTTGSQDQDPSFFWCSQYADCGSNSGSCVDIWAPAAHIISTKNDGSNACRLSGTSMAAPHVTGAVALYLQANPQATPAQVKAAVLEFSAQGELEDGITSPYSIGNSPNRILQLPFTHPPFAADDLHLTTYNTPTTILWSNLLSNDTDPDGDPLTLCDIGSPDIGTITASGGGSTTYNPPADCTTEGPAHFSYTVCDDQGGSDVGLVTIHINGIVCPPTD